MRGKYYVALLHRNSYALITKVNWDNKEVCFDNGEALELTQKQAREIMRHLATNGTLAAVLEVATWYTLTNNLE